MTPFGGRERAQREAAELRVREEQRFERIEQRRRFDDHFFKLTEAFRVLVINARITPLGSTRSYAGGEAFQELIARFKAERDLNPYVEHEEDAVIGYRKIFSAYQPCLGAYFRLLYQIYKYIDRSPLEDKDMYADILRAGLSSDELGLLALNALVEEGGKFIPFYRKYGILKHLPDSTIGPKTYSSVRKLLGDAAFEDGDAIPPIKVYRAKNGRLIAKRGEKVNQPSA